MLIIFLTWSSLLHCSLGKKIRLKRPNMVQTFLTKIACILELIELGTLHYKSELSKRFESKI